MSAPIEIVVRELREVGERAVRHRAQSARTPRTRDLEAWPGRGNPNLRWTPRLGFPPLPEALPRSAPPHLQEGHAHRCPAHPLPSSLLEALSPQGRRSSASSARPRGLDGSGRSKTRAVHGLRALIHFSTTAGRDEMGDERGRSPLQQRPTVPRAGGPLHLGSTHRASLSGAFTCPPARELAQLYQARSPLQAGLAPSLCFP